ncbi:MAG: YceI family protein [Polyangiaceae bacterium]
MRRIRGVGAVVGVVLAVAGCGNGAEGGAVSGGAGSAREMGGGAVSAGAEVAPGPELPPAPAVPRVSKWELDPENSSVGFVCKHVLTNVRGMIAQPSGTVVLDEGTPANSRVDVQMKVSGISTGVEERDMHLRGTEFFDAARYPVITFVSKR